MFVAPHKFKFPKILKTENLPTLTLAIPARNETLSMVDCLNKVEALNYPKMEVLVLDDQSTDGTNDIIRGFAHSGVRFIAGDEPAEGWIGKTYALEQLEAAASGEYIAFMNVDVRVAPDDLNYALSLMKEKHLDMISILPRHKNPFSGAAVMEPLRYFWNIFLPLTFRRTPVDGHFWIIRRDVLARLGGIKGQSYKIAPENALARRLIAKNSYRFFISGGFTRATNTEDLGHEFDSAVRNSFPRYENSITRSLLGALGHLILLAPFVIFALAYLVGGYNAILTLVSAVVILLEWVAATIYAFLTRPASAYLAWVFWPFQLIQEVVITLVSIYKYKFGHIEWRGRDIKLLVTNPKRPENWRPTEEYQDHPEKYLGDFKVTRWKNKIRKHRHA
jgi:glycosyltransferase involved in cell wall biosynthesis